MILIAKRNKNASGQKEDLYICRIVLNGRTNAFGLLVSKYQKRIFTLGLSFFKNETDAEDFVQDVMLKAYKALASFRGESAFSTWLLRIAYNLAINSVKRRREFSSFAEDMEIESSFLTPEEKHLRQCMKTSIRKAVDNLPEKYKVCIDLYFFYGMPYADIETVTNIPVNTVKSHIFRAKKILKGELEMQGLGGCVETFPLVLRRAGASA